MHRASAAVFATTTATATSSSYGSVVGSVSSMRGGRARAAGTTSSSASVFFSFGRRREERERRQGCARGGDGRSSGGFDGFCCEKRRRAAVLKTFATTAAASSSPKPEPMKKGTAKIQRISEENSNRVNILSEALPYLQRFQGQTVVVKYGGAAMQSKELKAAVIRDICLLATVGINMVLVHGGGPEINKMLETVGIEPNFKNGLRVTDDATMEVVEMVLTGKVNKELVALINNNSIDRSDGGGRAVGICGKDGNLLRGRVKDKDLGWVGEIESVDPKLLTNLIDGGFVPVIATVAQDSKGNALNVNADTAAGAIAAALNAQKLVLMTDVAGVCTDKDDVDSLIRTVTFTKAEEMIASGIIAGGMIPKVTDCMNALRGGCVSGHIIDGRAPHSLLLEILTDEGCGTMITRDDYE
jgi:acetylglutamate kinase